MGYAVIYMGMMVALALCEYRQSGLLNRVETTPTSPYEYLGSHIIANMIIATFQGLVVLLLALFSGTMNIVGEDLYYRGALIPKLHGLFGKR
jgi:ABC-type multidrug transport system permease subunit